MYHRGERGIELDHNVYLIPRERGFGETFSTPLFPKKNVLQSLKPLFIAFLANEPSNVAYFDQHLGAAHYKRWSRYAF